MNMEEACMKGDVDKVAQFIRDGNDPSTNNSEAIITACRYGHSDIVKLLLDDKRVNLLADDVIHTAIFYDKLDIIRLLIANYRYTDIRINKIIKGWERNFPYKSRTVRKCYVELVRKKSYGSQSFGAVFASFVTV